MLSFPLIMATGLRLVQLQLGLPFNWVLYFGDSICQKTNLLEIFDKEFIFLKGNCL